MTTTQHLLSNLTGCRLPSDVLKNFAARSLQIFNISTFVRIISLEVWVWMGGAISGGVAISGARRVIASEELAPDVCFYPVPAVLSFPVPEALDGTGQQFTHPIHTKKVCLKH